MRQLIELRAEPVDYLFKNTLGEPIDQRELLQNLLLCSEGDRHPHPRPLRDKGHLRLDGTDSRSQWALAFWEGVGCRVTHRSWSSPRIGIDMILPTICRRRKNRAFLFSDKSVGSESVARGVTLQDGLPSAP